MKEGCFFTRNGEHLYKNGSRTCELCGEEKKRGQGLYRRNKVRPSKEDRRTYEQARNGF
jgi:hypothetical protein